MENLPFGYNIFQMLMIARDDDERKDILKYISDADPNGLCEVTTAETTADGLVCIEQKSFDCVVVDADYGDYENVVEFIRGATTSKPNIPIMIIISRRRLTEVPSINEIAAKHEKIGIMLKPCLPSMLTTIEGHAQRFKGSDLARLQLKNSLALDCNKFKDVRSKCVVWVPQLEERFKVALQILHLKNGNAKKDVFPSDILREMNVIHLNPTTVRSHLKGYKKEISKRNKLDAGEQSEPARKKRKLEVGSQSVESEDPKAKLDQDTLETVELIEEVVSEELEESEEESDKDRTSPEELHEIVKGVLI